MNAFLVVLIVFGGLIAWEKNLLDQMPMTLDSLCVVSKQDCVRNPNKNLKKPLSQMEGYYCLDDGDLHKIVSKLEREKDR